MSVPVSYCSIVSAADDPAVFYKLHPVMHRNIKGRHFTMGSCPHDPPCRGMSIEEMNHLMQRFGLAPEPQGESENGE